LLFYSLGKTELAFLRHAQDKWQSKYAPMLPAVAVINRMVSMRLLYKGHMFPGQFLGHKVLDTNKYGIGICSLEKHALQHSPALDRLAD